ncbi:hypothetical protein [Larkinella soli]|uniref:hypothetical protein n=1 Tax=Larkinella soli TaxID=1770527 RepID=UPI000FFBEDD3|nr:hypothetical protein [Larkinella soli]
MHPAPQQRTILNWIQPSTAERYEIYSELGMPRAVLTINGQVSATLETQYGTYTIQRQSLFTTLHIKDTDGELIADVRSGWWGRRYLRFHDGREMRFNASNVFRSRWLWSSADGEPRAIVKQNQIFFSPDWPVREGLSSLLAGLTIYLMVTKPSMFTFFS